MLQGDKRSHIGAMTRDAITAELARHRRGQSLAWSSLMRTLPTFATH